ncbi:MAG: hypothetical protein JXO48_10445 [Deltaproteobacteria bacterium]|nr:hypothetical protein [Deltaproteobacteria bacterium]
MSDYDSRMIRCLKLGGEVTFAYCRREQGGLPCSRIIGCWRGMLPVEDYLKSALSPEEMARCFGQLPKDRITTMFEIVDAVKKQGK